MTAYEQFGLIAEAFATGIEYPNAVQAMGRLSRHTDGGCILIVSDVVLNCPHRFVSAQTVEAPLRCLKFFNDDYANKSKSLPRFIENYETSRFFVDITDGKVKLNGKEFTLRECPKEAKSGACFTIFGPNASAAAYSTKHGLAEMNFGKKKPMQDMTTRQAMAEENPEDCSPGPFSLYNFAQG